MLDDLKNDLSSLASKVKSLRSSPPPMEQRRQKPPQPTIVRRSTALSLRYLEDHGLADFRSSRLVVAPTPREIEERLKRLMLCGSVQEAQLIRKLPLGPACGV